VLRALRQQLTYANAMATIAAFIALGGGAYAAATITGRDVKDSSLTGKDLRRNSVGGKQLAEARLGKVRRARNADRLAGKPASSYRVRCPEGTAPVSNTCIETRPRAAAPYSTAATECENTGRPAGPGRRLPSHDELMTSLGDFGIALADGGELTRNVYPPSAPGRRLDVLTIIDPTGNVAVTSDTADGARAFRCVADPIN
jgi:hypothetical protein